MEINDADIGEFEKNGVLLLRGVFNNWVDTLRAGVESNMQTPGPWSREYIQPGEPGRFSVTIATGNASISTVISCSIRQRLDWLRN
jgi:hypothetical protein